MRQAEVSSDNLAKDIVGFVYRSKLGRDPVPEEYEHQKKFLLEKTVTVEVYDAAIAGTPEAKEFLRAKTGQLPDEVLHYDGCAFTLPPKSGLAACLRHPKGYEWWALPAFLSLCKPGATVVDIGANWGIYALPAARRIGPSGKVFAFEAAPENAKMIVANAARNKLANIELLTVAMSDRFGMAALPAKRVQNAGHVYLDRTDAIADGVDWEPVTTIPLDAMRGVIGRVNLMKLDIEGGEYRALLGAQTIVKQDRPIIFMEFCPLLLKSISKAEPGAVLGAMLDLNYSIEVLRHEGPPEQVTGARGSVIERVVAQCDDVTTHIDLKLTPRAA